jgi:hypothetical protein
MPTLYDCAAMMSVGRVYGKARWSGTQCRQSMQPLELSPCGIHSRIFPQSNLAQPLWLSVHYRYQSINYGAAHCYVPVFWALYIG